jgi:hypothetical protein
MADFIANYGLYAAYILAGLAILLVIVLPLINSINDPKSLLGTAIGVVFIGILFFIGWSVSSSEAYTRYGVTETYSKVIGGALITMYILAIIALVGIVFSEVSKIFK